MKTLAAALCGSLLAAIPSTSALADGYDNSYYLQAYSSTTHGTTDQQTTALLAAILSVSTQAQGVNAYGNTYIESSMVLAGAGGFDLFASSSLSGGSSSGYGLAESQAGNGAAMSFDFLIPQGVSYITETVYADGHGEGTTGGASVSGFANVYTNGVPCGFALTGVYQSETCKVLVTPGLGTFELSGDMDESSFEPGDSAYQDYWGTFSAGLDYYDANGDLIGQYDFAPPASPTPEPSSLILLGTGVLGVVGAMRRRFLS